VNIALNIDAAGMLDSAMPILKRDSVVIPQEANAVVRTQFIGIDGAARSDVLLE